MKKSYYLIFCLLFLAFNSVALSTSVIINGLATNAAANTKISVSYGDSVFTTSTSSNGKFCLVVSNIHNDTPAQFRCGNQSTRIFLTNGDKLKIKFDLLRFDETIHYTGHGANANNYLAKYLLKYYYNSSNGVNKLKKMSESPISLLLMKNAADSVRNDQILFYKYYEEKHNLTKRFKQDALLNIDLEWATILLEHCEFLIHNIQPKILLKESDFDFINNINVKSLSHKIGRDIDENTLIFRFLTAYEMRILPSGVLSQDSEQIKSIYKQATSDLGDNLARDIAIYIMMKNQLENNLQSIIVAYPEFKKQNKDSISSKNMRENLNLRIKLNSTKKSPVFSLINNKGDQISLKSFIGKVVYLDFWGTWCLPCIEEMKASVELKKRFKNEDVVFVYISVGDKFEKWNKFINDNNYINSNNSVHLHSSDMNVASEYQVVSYPTYFIISREGNILISRAPHPSERDKAITAIENALASEE